MRSEVRPSDFHPQDWIIIAEALAQWGGPPDEIDDGRRERAYELIEAIGADLNISSCELVRQADWTYRK